MFPEYNSVNCNSFQNQFIIGSRYSFILNTQLREDIITKYEVKDIRKSHFYFNGTVDLRAQNGQVGTLLLDPTNIFVATNQANATKAGMVGVNTSAGTLPQANLPRAVR